MRALALVVGRPDSGKTAWLDAVVQRARSRGLQAEGLLSRGIRNNGRKSGFFLEDVASGERRLLAQERPDSERTLFYGRFYFAPATFAWGNAVLQACAGTGTVVIDECGPLELSGAGLWPGIRFLLRHHVGPILIAVRPGLQTEVRQKILSLSDF
ncbi:MAG TPA: nucleoside-triphosphatase [bacterium]|nr:nucleoside-triphosphatase [bacterium]HPR89608.1 nucleoside-triphosphatase [bacterium]